MSIDEAIKYYSHLADECRRKAHIERNDYMDLKDLAAEHEQLADWLNELKILREKIQKLLEKQEQTNAQNVNSTHRSCPNALESLNILEQAKDDKGCVPMSLVRQAFRNVMEQDKWISCKERLPENKKKVLVSYDTEDGKKVDVSMFDKYGCLLGLVSAWRPLPEPYTKEEFEEDRDER